MVLFDDATRAAPLVLGRLSCLLVQVLSQCVDVRETIEGLEAKGVQVHCLALGGADLTSPADKAIIRERLADGASLGQMASEYNVSRAAIQRVQKAAV